MRSSKLGFWDSPRFLKQQISTDMGGDFLMLWLVKNWVSGPKTRGLGFGWAPKMDGENNGTPYEN